MQKFEITPEKLKEMRTAKGWSLNDFATASGVSRSTLSVIELGKLKGFPRAETLRHIKEALGIEGEIVWTGEIAASVRVRRQTTRPKLPPTPKDEKEHTYTIVIRTPASDRHILTTKDRREAHCKYAALCASGRLPRVIMDKQSLPIYIADKMFPQRQGDTHRRYEITKTKKRKSQPAG